MVYRYTDKEKKDNLVYEGLSYQVIGCLYSVWNNLGFGYQEKVYEKALAKEFVARNIKYSEQLPVKIQYKNSPLGLYYFDFLVENKIVLELKVRNYFSKKDIEQVYAYLKVKKLYLGIIAHFSRNGVKIKRVVNLI